MLPTVSNMELIAACGLYCGSCRKYRKGKCPGCRANEKATWCSIRKCCHAKGFSTCANCPIKDINTCKTFNNLFTRILGILFNSDRAACIRFIRRNGPERYANRMSVTEQMTIRRR
ncbi:MAG: DUF3795 domain-containing protein [Prevotella sp.]|nr:DUF3795 domain-containing protein [Prevotella sp.]